MLDCALNCSILVKIDDGTEIPTESLLFLLPLRSRRPTFRIGCVEGNPVEDERSVVTICLLCLLNPSCRTIDAKLEVFTRGILIDIKPSSSHICLQFFEKGRIRYRIHSILSSHIAGSYALRRTHAPYRTDTLETPVSNAMDTRFAACR